jgi:competence protein ComEC
MQFFHNYPLLLPAVFFGVGCFWGIEPAARFYFEFYSCLGAWAFLTVFWLGRKYLLGAPNTGWQAGVYNMMITFPFFLFGGLNGYYQTTPRANHGIRLAGKQAEVEGTLLSPIKKNKYGFSATLQLDFLLTSNKKTPLTGKAILYFKRLESTTIGMGKKVRLRGNIERIAELNNKGYQKYLEQQQIRIRIKAPAISLSPSYKRSIIVQKMEALRQKWLAEIDYNFTNPQTRVIAKAFLLGVRTEIPSDLKSAYSVSGVAHILALSGAHIAMLILFLQFLLTPFFKVKQGAPYFSLFLVFLVITYAWLAGWSASVVRAAYMGSALILGNAVYRKSSTLNILSFCAFLQLAIEPALIQDAGFLLSYAAVLGIVLLNPVFQRYWFFRSSWWGQSIGALLSVTLAAQLFTLPIILYYFGVFPSYFLLANFLLNPLFFLILITGFAFLLCSFIPGVNAALGELCGFWIEVMNEIILYIAHLPYSQIENIQLPYWGALLSAGIILTLTIILRRAISASRQRRLRAFGNGKIEFNNIYL